MPEFSVIIPVYNSQDTLARCIDSVLNQTVQDFEVLCCYDDSADDSRKIIESYCRKDGRVRFIQGRGKGLSGARNDGLNVASGTYILFLDSDDCFFTHALEVIKKSFVRYKTDIVVFGARAVPSVPLAPEWYRFTLRTPHKVYKTFAPRALLGEPSARPFVWRDAFRREFLERNALRFDEECRVGEDQVFQMQVFPLAENGIAFIHRTLYKYVWRREDSLMARYRKDVIARLLGHIRMVDAVYSFWQRRGYDCLSRRQIALWTVDFLGTDIPRQEECTILAISYELDTLLRKWPIAQYVMSLSPVTHLWYGDLCSHKPHTYTKYEMLIQKLWWYWYTNGIICAMYVLWFKAWYWLRLKYAGLLRKINFRERCTNGFYE